MFLTIEYHPNSFGNLWIQMLSLTARRSAIYSDSVDEMATVSSSFDIQLTAAPANLNKNAIIDFLPSDAA